MAGLTGMTQFILEPGIHVSLIFYAKKFLFGAQASWRICTRGIRRCSSRRRRKKDPQSLLLAGKSFNRRVEQPKRKSLKSVRLCEVIPSVLSHAVGR